MLREQFDGIHPPHIFEMPVSVAYLESLPYDGHRYEVIDGEIFIEEFPLIAHQRVIGNLATGLSNHIECEQGEVIPQVGITLDEYTCIVPDVIYISHERLKNLIGEDGLIHGAPELVIEVISPTGVNQHRDRIVKPKIYAHHGVSEFWLADIQRRTIEIYRLTDARLHLHATLMENDNLTTPLLPDFSCAVSKIFAR